MTQKEQYLRDVLVFCMNDLDTAMSWVQRQHPAGLMYIRMVRELLAEAHHVLVRRVPAPEGARTDDGGVS